MLANLTPSVELTGGPWYSDGGLDQAFIDGLLKVCLNHVKKLASSVILPAHKASNTSVPDIPPETAQKRRHPRRDLRPEPDLPALPYQASPLATQNPRIHRRLGHLAANARGRTCDAAHERARL